MDEYLTMEVSRPDRGMVRIACSGEVDLYTGPRLREKIIEVLREFTPESLELDFTNVESMDGSGLFVLEGGYARGRAIGCRVAVTRLKDRVQRAFRLTGFPEHNGVSLPVPGDLPAWPADTDRARIGEVAIKHTLAHARQDIDIEYRAVQQGHAVEMATATEDLLTLAGALSLTDPAATSPELRSAIATAARLSAAYVAVTTGQDVFVSLDYPEEWSGIGLQVHGDTSHGLGLEAWLRAVELALIVGDEVDLRMISLLDRVSIAEDAGPALTYARALAAWVEGAADEVPSSAGDGAYVAELAMLRAAVAGDSAAFNTALGQAVMWHRSDVEVRESASSLPSRVHSVDIKVTHCGDLIAYRPLAVVAAVLRRDPEWPVLVESDYLPRALLARQPPLAV